MSAHGCLPIRAATLSTVGCSSRRMASPPVSPSARRSSLSQRGAHWTGSLRSATTMSASAQAAMNFRQSMNVDERVARMCQLRPSRSTRAMQASRLQRAKSLAARKPGSPSWAAASPIKSLTNSPVRSRSKAGVPSAPTNARWRPSPVTSKSGNGVAAAHSAPSAAGTRPEQRARVVHRHSHSPPKTISPKAGRGIAGSIATAPLALATVCAMPSSRSMANPVALHRGAPSPTASSKSAPASKRHDDEGRQRNGDDVCRDPVKPGAVEMIERQGDQRDFDHQSGQNHRPERSCRSAQAIPHRGAGKARGPTAASAARRSRSPRRSSAGNWPRQSLRDGIAARPTPRPPPAAG